MMTDNATLRMVDGTDLSQERVANFVNTNPEWNPVLIGDIIIVERPTTPGSPTWLIASQTLVPGFSDLGDVREIELLSIVRQDGTLLIKVHESWWGQKPR